MSQISQVSSSSSIGDWLLGSITRNPEGLLLLAAGTVLLMRSGGRTHSTAWSSPRGQTSSRFAEAADDASKASKYVSDIAEGARKTAESATSTIYDYAAEAPKVIGEKSGRAFQRTQSTLQDTLNRVLKDQPLAVAIAGIAAGAALASAFPATRLEKETLGPIGEKISDAANHIGSRIKEATTKAGETIQNVAEERGLTRDGLKDAVTEVAEAVAEGRDSRHSGQSSPREQGGASQQSRRESNE